MKQFSVLFVCLGNICRSPTAEGVFKSLAKNALSGYQLRIDSAGTSAYHVGEHSDQRAIKYAARRNYDLSKILSRQVTEEDFANFDLIIAMDKDNHSNLIQLAQSSGYIEDINKIKLFLDFSNQIKYVNVPDPYYGGDQGFDLVIDLIEDASKGLIEYIRKVESA